MAKLFPRFGAPLVTPIGCPLDLTPDDPLKCPPDDSPFEPPWWLPSDAPWWLPSGTNYTQLLRKFFLKWSNHLSGQIDRQTDRRQTAINSEFFPNEIRLKHKWLNNPIQQSSLLFLQPNYRTLTHKFRTRFFITLR